MNTTIVPGATVRGPFTVFNDITKSQEVLVDKHLIVLAVSQGKAMCMYTGTFDSGKKHQNLPGFVEVSQSQNELAGWRNTSKFYADACMLCVVPMDRLETVGRVSNGFLKTLENRVLSLKGRVVTTAFSATAAQRVTGTHRQIRNGEYA